MILKILWYFILDSVRRFVMKNVLLCISLLIICNINAMTSPFITYTTKDDAYFAINGVKMQLKEALKKDCPNKEELIRLSLSSLKDIVE